MTSEKKSGRRFANHRAAVLLLALVAMAAVAGCGGGSSSSTTAREKKISRPSSSREKKIAETSGSSVSKRGVLTFKMVEVGDPGNHSVGVIQTFGGPKGEFVDLPKGTGIYKNCSEAPRAPPECQG